MTHASRQFSTQIPSVIGEVGSACRAIRDLLGQCHLESRAFEVELVARECLNNAVLHGNKSDPKKKASLSIRIGRKWICLRVQDKGAGFDWKSAPQTRSTDSKSSGRGLSIIKLYSKRVTHNRKGNEVTVWMSRTKT